MIVRNQALLTSTVMLETMWKTKGNDLIDLISPFVDYCIGKEYSTDEIIDLRNICEIIKKEFGYVDMPVAVVETVLKRRPDYFKKSSGKYTLTKALNDTVVKLEKKRDECEKKIQEIGDQIADYLSAHVRWTRTFTKDDAIDALQGFFVRHGVFLGVNQLEENAPTLHIHENDYYIAQYIFEKKDQHRIEYEQIIDLVKGYFLQSAIYLQASNGNVATSTYKKVQFYYDTPFLIRLLGYKSEEETNTAQELHYALQKQKGSFFFFPQTQHEIEGILNAYKTHINDFTNITLEGLDEKRYSSSDVERLQRNWENKLKSDFSILLIESPEYPRKEDGSVDESQLINESEIKEIIRDNIPYNKEDNLCADIESIIAICNIRSDNYSRDIESCNAVFVTTNKPLVRVFNDYYRNHFSADAFPLLITDSDLAALTWIKCGSVGDLPERVLLRNAYMAAQPTSEMLTRFSQVFDQMQNEGELSEDVAIAIRSSAYTKKAVLFAAFDGVENITQDTIYDIARTIKEEYSKTARQEEIDKAKRKERKEKHERVARAEKMARDAATEAKAKLLKRERIIAVIIEIVISVTATYVTLITWKSMLWIGIPLLAFILLNTLSIIDIAFGFGKAIDKLLLKRANHKYDKVYYEKRAEYRGIEKEWD